MMNEVKIRKEWSLSRAFHGYGRNRSIPPWDRGVGIILTGAATV